LLFVVNNNAPCGWYVRTAGNLGGGPNRRRAIREGEPKWQLSP
jgi:hypothetical protein